MRKRFLLFLSLFAATTVSAQLSGTYIINSDSSQNPDFVSFSEAASALSAGVSGQVVFEVAPGTFMEYVNIGEINGTSAENKVVFKGMGADNQQVTITSNAGYTANSTLTLSGTDFVTFENMTLSSTSEHTAHVVKLLGGNEGVRFQNVRFVGCVSTTSNTDNEKNLVYRLSGNWVDNDNAFVGCEFVNGFIGLYYQGYNINQYNNGVLVEDCHFSNQCSKAIYTTFTDHVILRGNTVVNKNDSKSDFNAIDMFQCRFGCLIENNVMTVEHPTKYVTVVKLRPCTGTADEPVIVRNNIVDLRCGASSSWCYAFDNANSGHIYFAHNTAKCSGTGASGNLYVQKNWPDLYVYNNLFVNETDGYVLRFQNNSVNRFCDYNRVSFSGNNVGFFAGTAYATLEAWHTATGFDANSSLCSPAFADDNDLHITSAEGLAVAHPLDYATLDIDGDERGETPCAGADEWVDADLPPVVVNPLAPIVFTTFPQTMSHNVVGCFDDPDDNNSLMEFEVLDCPPEVSATINAEKTLVVSRNTPLAFNKTFVVRAKSNGKHADMEVSVSGDEVDQPPHIANPLPNVVFNLFPQTIHFGLEGVATDPDDPDEDIVYSLVSNSNETDLIAQLDGTTLVLTRTNHHQNSAILSMSAESDGQTVDFSINVIINETPDLPPIVTQPIEDIVSEYFPETIRVDLEGVATDPDDFDENITYGLVSNSNPLALSAQINNKELVLERATGYDANADLVLRATSNGLSVDFNAHVILARVVDLPPYLAKPLGDMVMNSFPESIQIDLAGVATDPDDPDENIVYTVVSNSNPQSLKAKISNNVLELERLTGLAATSILTLRATSYWASVDFSVRVTMIRVTNLPPHIQKPFGDVVMNSFPESIQIGLEGVATDPDDPDENIVYTMVSNNNPHALMARINDNELLLERLSEEADSAHLVIRASNNGLFADFEFNVIMNAFVNIKELRMSVLAYPNPATDRLTLAVPDTNCFDYEFYHSTGQRILKGQAVGQSANIDLSTWPKGTYVVHVIAGNKRLAQTVLVR